MSRLELLQGTLDMLVLKALSRGPMHGYEIARWIQQTSEDALQVEEGSLYPALYRMERKGWIRSEWGLSEKNRKARYYKATKAGRRHLESEAHIWGRLTEAIAKIMQTA
ncbi:MAG TPA: PadR family transcriptional regulator [Blastocatellia bacterium]|nr:PadR family transcriptional regulator [Blastocatellia bacterium]